MEKAFVYIVSSAETALNVNHKLNDLDRNEDINLYQSVTIRKDNSGGYEILKDNTSEGGWKTLGGTAIGSLIGLVGGPLGVLLGGVTGAAIGAAADTGDFAVSADFIGQINENLHSGDIAVIALIDESNPAFVDAALKSFEGKFYRTDVDSVYQDYQQRVDEEIAEEKEKEDEQRAIEKAKRKEHRNERKANFKKKITDWWNNL